MPNTSGQSPIDNARPVSDHADVSPAAVLEERNLVLSELIKVLFCSWANIFLIFVPAGFAVNYTHQSSSLIFAISFVAIVGPSAVLEFAVREVQRRYASLIGNLVSITFRFVSPPRSKSFIG